MRRAFTLIELLVVIGMIALLMGAIGSGVNKSRKRAMVAKAMQDAKEITNAILAYENYAPDRSLESKANNSWQDTTEGAMGMILGKETTEGGETVPILYNAQIRGNGIRDPWGECYQYIIRKADTISGTSGRNQNFITAPSLPNFYRLTDEERQ